MSTDTPIPLSKYIKLLAGPNVTVQKAMDLAGKVYKNFKTPNQLANLSDVDLIRAGLHEKDDRSLFMTAMRNAGYIAKSPAVKDVQPAPSTADRSPISKKRKRPEIKNEFLPDHSSENGPAGLEWEEILDEKVLMGKSTVTNRAPLIAAWATIVAECLGFEREEALSIATVYTEMNAISKGVSLGVYDSSKKAKAPEAPKEGTQPYVDFMGRRIPLFQTKDSRWWALGNGVPTPPQPMLSYITRSFRQTTPFIMGSLRLLAESWSSDTLKEKAWDLYAEFRPVVSGWGKRGEVKCETILKLRNTSAKAESSASQSTQLIVKSESADDIEFRESSPKRRKGAAHSYGPEQMNVTSSSLEDSELEAQLDNDDFKDFDFSTLP